MYIRHLAITSLQKLITRPGKAIKTLIKDVYRLNYT